jgi:hypothetical protein
MNPSPSPFVLSEIEGRFSGAAFGARISTLLGPNGKR